MNFNKLIPELSVTDINRTRKFYVDVLGFKICYERPEDKFIFVEKDGNQIMLEQINDNWNVGGTEYHVEEFFIRTADQEKSYGTEFFNLIEKSIPVKGATQIFLQTESNVPAYNFHKKRGFIELKNHVSFFKELGK